jgi:hypothetical protein
MSPFLADFVAKRFCSLERTRLIQDQAPMRNVDSNSMRSDSIVSYFYSTASPRRLLQQNRHVSDIQPPEANVRCWGPIVLQNDFAHPSAQDRFKIGRQCALLIQKFMRPDSIVSNFYSTASPRRLLQHNRGPKADIPPTRPLRPSETLAV